MCTPPPVRSGGTAEPAVARRPDEWPPPLVVLAGVGAAIGVVPGVLFGVVVLLSGGWALTLLGSPVLALGTVVVPWLLGFGALRLLSRTSRWPLIISGLPVTALAGRVLHDAARGNGEPWLALVLIGPALAPLLALAPSVEEWLRAEDPEPARPGL